MRPGERILTGGRRREVRELLRAAAVPRWARRSYPVVAASDGLVLVPRPAKDSNVAQPVADLAAGSGWARDGVALSGDWAAT